MGKKETVVENMYVTSSQGGGRAGMKSMVDKDEERAKVDLSGNDDDNADNVATAL